jgi:tetratricopeptide (TPR) repeat protein
MSVAPPSDRRRFQSHGLIWFGLAVILAFVLVLIQQTPWFQLSRAGRTLAAGDPEQAAAQLRTITAHLPASTFTWRQLARAELQRGDPVAAVAALEQALSLDPNDPLIGHELALALEAAGDYTAADARWEALGVDPIRQSGYGSAAFSARQYDDAVTWFERALRTSDALDPVQQFHFGVAAVMTSAADAALSAGPYTLQVESAGSVPGARLRWITAHPRYNVASGAFLSQAADSGAGIFFWNGSAVVALDNTHSGHAFLRVRARHSRPAPVRLAVELQGRRVGEFNLERGTEQTLTHTMLVETTAGPQAVIISFLNDGVVDGIDRNAVIEWVELIPAD